MGLCSFAAPTVYDCNFESGFCKWQQAHDDKFDWTRTQGPTGSQSTGPTNDHTLGTGQFPSFLGQRFFVQYYIVYVSVCLLVYLIAHVTVFVCSWCCTVQQFALRFHLRKMGP